jgi:hypothetical protein
MQGRRFFRTAPAVCVAFLLAGGVVVAASDTPLPGAQNLGLMTIANDLAYFAGQYVRIPVVRVHEVITPRVFSIEVTGIPPTGMWPWDNRALVVLASPISVKPGDLVEIVGRPWTMVEARERVDKVALGELDPRVVRRFEDKPVIGADLVRTPGGIQLYAR